MSSDNFEECNRNIDGCGAYCKQRRIGYKTILLVLVGLIISISVVSSVDITPPGSVTNLVNITYKQSYINWTWKDPSTYDFSKVVIYVDGKFKTNVSKGKRYYNATGFLPNTSHKISTHTVDMSGNINRTWVNRSTRTAVDTAPPISITNLSVSSYGTTYISWKWKDPSTYDFSNVMIYVDGKFKTNVPKGRRYYNATGFLPNTSHKISTRTVDTSGNVNKTWVNNTKRTANPSISTFKFIVWGDTKGGVGVLEAESKSIINKNPNFTLYVGDLCSDGPDTACFVIRKKAINGDLTGVTNNRLFNRTFAIRGNHDSSGGSVWQSGFNFNNVALSIGATNYVEQTTDMTYSFDYGNSHFVGIDNPCSNINSCAGDMTSSQITWLDNDLTNAENRGLKHAFLFWHGPLYPVDGHCCGGASSALIAVLNRHPIISAGLFGHEHVVEYTHLDSGVIPSLSCSFEQVISGGSGASLYGLTGGRRVNYYLDQSQGQVIYGYTMINVSGDNFDISFYKTDGTNMRTLSFTETGICQ